MGNAESRYSIYKITSPSGKVYIGQTKNVKKRFTSYKNCKPTQRLIRRSIMKYGYTNHNFEVLLDSLSKEEADTNEVKLIKDFKDQKISLNIADGGYVDISFSRKKKVVKLTLNGEFIEEYESVTAAANSENISCSSICTALKTHGYSSGFLWEYKDKYTSDYKIRWTQKIFVTPKEPEPSIYKFDLEGNLVTKYESVKDAATDNKTQPNIIIKCLSNPKKTVNKFRYSYNNVMPVHIHNNSKRVRQYTLDGEFIQEFISSKEACRVLGIVKSTLTNKTKQPHKIKPIYPYTFKYVTE